MAPTGVIGMSHTNRFSRSEAMPEAAMAPDSAGGASEPPDACEPTAYRILIVDDMPAIHEDIRKIFDAHRQPSPLDAESERLFGTAPAPAQVGFSFRIDSTYQGGEAIARVREAAEAGERYAVAFVDMRMPPGLDGLETIAALWEIDPALQIVVLSAYSDYSWEEIVRRTGQTDRLVILRKPFDGMEVLQLGHALAAKWSLQCAQRRQLRELEEMIAQRTQELSERQAFFALILENVTDLIAVIDGHGNRIFSSPSYRSTLGHDPQELAGPGALALIHPDDIGLIKGALIGARATGKGQLLVYRMRHKDGSWRALESCIGIVRRIDSATEYFVVVARDVTLRRELDLRNLLSQKLESIGQLAAGVAHEINTPTQYITDNTRFLIDGFAQLAQELQRRPPAPDAAATLPRSELDYLLGEIPRALQHNLEGLQRVARIVRSLKEYSHPSSPDKAPNDLNHAIENTIALCRHEWKYVADVVTELDPDLPPVPCVLDEINQALLNLIVNAAHAIEEALKQRGEKRGTIAIRTRLEGVMAVVEVSDTGTGIPVELRKKIFEPFFTTKEVGRGTGQGLAIVQAVVVKHHQGTIDLVSDVGRGTTFRLRLPLDAAASPAGPVPQPPSP